MGLKFVFPINLFLCGLLFILSGTNSNAQDVIKFDKYDEMMKTVIKDKNTVYVINFWATWCAPCVKELPHFEKLNAENNNVKVILVSLDFKDQFDTRLLPFLKNKNIKSTVVFLSDKNQNDWLPKVDEDWQGAIPATLIIQGNRKLFAQLDFNSFEELNQHVNKFINNK